MKYSIVIPCYNESDNIPLILKRFAEVIEGYEIEVILINNGSTDDTEMVIEKLLPQYTFARCVLVPVNQGYGYGILQGLKSANGDYIGWTHADMQTDPGDVIKAVDIIEKSADKDIYVKGNRKGRPIFDMIFTWGMSIFETIYFKTSMFDISLDLYAVYMAKRKGIKVIRFPVLFPDRLNGESKWNTDGMRSKIKFINRTLSFSFELKKRMLNKEEY